MKLNNIKFLQFLAFSLAGGLVASVPAAILCCLVFLFILVPMMPIIFIPCWFSGAILGWATTPTEKELPIRTYSWSVAFSVIVIFLIVYKWFYPDDIVWCIIWTYIFSCVFAACSFPIIIYIKKKIIPDIFMPPIPRNNH